MVAGEGDLEDEGTEQKKKEKRKNKKELKKNKVKFNHIIYLFAFT